jgi:Leucine-rich repeat (LRR) protein
MKKRGRRRDEEEEGKIILKKEFLLAGLCDFGIQDSLKSVGYRKLNLAGLNLDFLKNVILEYRNIQYIDLSNNQLVDIQLLLTFDNLVYLNIANNKIKHINYLAEEDRFPNLQHLEAQNNKFVELPLLKVPKLTYLDVSDNAITKYDRIEGGHPSLTVFKANNNKFKSLFFFKDMPKLREIYLNDNVIATINDFENIPELQILSLDRNKIEKIEEEMPELPKLTTISLQGNKLTSKEQVQKLLQYSALKEINVLENLLFEPENEYAVHEILMMNTQLTKINEVEITPVILQEAIFLGELLWRKQEEERIAKEREEQERAEREAAQENA